MRPSTKLARRMLELRLLTLLQQVEVEGLLDLLLTLDGDQVLGLLGARGNAGGIALLAGLEAIDLCGERDDDVIQALGHCATELGERMLKVQHAGVRLTTIGLETVVVDEVLVVLPDEALYMIATDAGVGRQHAPLVTLV